MTRARVFQMMLQVAAYAYLGERKKILKNSTMFLKPERNQIARRFIYDFYWWVRGPWQSRFIVSFGWSLAPWFERSTPLRQHLLHTVLKAN